MTLISRVTSVDGIACAGIAHLLDHKVVEIYGEIHGMSNEFCRQVVDGCHLHDYEVLCEITPYRRSNACTHASTGIEYVFANLPCVPGPLCFDLRRERGLPSCAEELRDLSFFKSMIPSAFDTQSLEYLEQFVDRTRIIYTQLSREHTWFSREFGCAYEQISSSIGDELSIVRTFIARGLLFINTGHNRSVLCSVGNALTHNVQKLCAALVDLHVKSLILKSKSKKIVVFTGAAHAFRLVDILFRDTAAFIVEPNDELVIDLMFLSEGDYEHEKALLFQFEGTKACI
jgi:hypothetical protein